MKKCQDLPGQDLFQYVDKDGTLQQVRSEDVNDYLRDLGQADFTAKDFRTWAGTVLAAMALQKLERVTNRRKANKNIIQAIETAAKRLGNTTSVCKKCYVHPAVLEAYVEGTLVDTLRKRANAAIRGVRHMRPQESLVLGLLLERLVFEQQGGSLIKQLRRSIKQLPQAKRQ